MRRGICGCGRKVRGLTYTALLACALLAAPAATGTVWAASAGAAQAANDDGMFSLMSAGAAVSAQDPAAAVGPGASVRPSTNGVTIEISKRAGTLTLKQNGYEIGTWNAKLGRESATGDKVQEGDEITPSGKFYVCTRNDKSAYYLALGLSYPSTEDAERGLKTGLITQEQYDAIVTANKKGETPPWNTPLGGAIEIHGDQSDRGTAGCIAMTNDVMDILWSYCNLGVPVTIGP